MKTAFRIIILTAISLLILAGVISGILNVLGIYTTAEALEIFTKSTYVILIIAFGISAIALIKSLFTK